MIKKEDDNNTLRQDDGKSKKKNWKTTPTPSLAVTAEAEQYQRTCVFRLCVDAYFIGPRQSEAGAYSITAASEHIPTCLLDNTHTQSSSIVSTLVQAQLKCP